jgi:hypothetical protein
MDEDEHMDGDTGAADGEQRELVDAARAQRRQRAAGGRVRVPLVPSAQGRGEGVDDRGVEGDWIVRPLRPGDFRAAAAVPAAASGAVHASASGPPSSASARTVLEALEATAAAYEREAAEARDRAAALEPAAAVAAASSLSLRTQLQQQAAAFDWLAGLRDACARLAAASARIAPLVGQLTAATAALEGDLRALRGDRQAARAFRWLQDAVAGAAWDLSAAGGHWGDVESFRPAFVPPAAPSSSAPSPPAHTQLPPPQRLSLSISEDVRRTFAAPPEPALASALRAAAEAVPVRAFPPPAAAGAAAQAYMQQLRDLYAVPADAASAVAAAPFFAALGASSAAERELFDGVMRRLHAAHTLLLGGAAAAAESGDLAAAVASLRQASGAEAVARGGNGIPPLVAEPLGLTAPLAVFYQWKMTFPFARSYVSSYTALSLRELLRPRVQAAMWHWRPLDEPPSQPPRDPSGHWQGWTDERVDQLPAECRWIAPAFAFVCERAAVDPPPASQDGPAVVLPLPAAPSAEALRQTEEAEDALVPRLASDALVPRLASMLRAALDPLLPAAVARARAAVAEALQFDPLPEDTQALAAALTDCYLDAIDVLPVPLLLPPSPTGWVAVGAATQLPLQALHPCSAVLLTRLLCLGASLDSWGGPGACMLPIDVQRLRDALSQRLNGVQAALAAEERTRGLAETLGALVVALWRDRR